MEKTPYITIVFPAFNEERNISNGCLDVVDQYFSKQPYKTETIIVDDGSTDQTVPLVEQFMKNRPNFRLIRNPHRGKAFTVQTGVEAASGCFILFSDMDQATPPQEIEKLLPFIEKRDYDIAIGSREIMGSKREQEPWYRHVMGKGFNFLVQLIAIRNIHDTQCGFKLFKGTLAKELFSDMIVNRSQKRVKGPLVTVFDVELLFLAHKRGYRIAEVPVLWRHVATNRVNPVKDSVRSLIDILKIRFNDVRGLYDTKATKP